MSQVKEQFDQSLIDYDAPTKAELDQAVIDILASIDSGDDKIELIRKITRNKVTRSGNIITVFEDNGTTEHARYDLTNGERIPL